VLIRVWVLDLFFFGLQDIQISQRIIDYTEIGPSFLQTSGTLSALLSVHSRLWCGSGQFGHLLFHRCCFEFPTYLKD
jgi:hypothetical protein